MWLEGVRYGESSGSEKLVFGIGACVGVGVFGNFVLVLGTVKVVVEGWGSNTIRKFLSRKLLLLQFRRGRASSQRPKVTSAAERQNLSSRMFLYADYMSPIIRKLMNRRVEVHYCRHNCVPSHSFSLYH